MDSTSQTSELAELILHTYRIFQPQWSLNYSGLLPNTAPRLSLFFCFLFFFLYLPQKDIYIYIHFATVYLSFSFLFYSFFICHRKIYIYILLYYKYETLFIVQIRDIFVPFHRMQLFLINSRRQLISIEIEIRATCFQI